MKSYKILISIISFGPLHSKKASSKFDCEIEIEISTFSKEETDETNNDLFQLKTDLKYLANNIILCGEYPKSIISISFEILQNDGPVFARLVNLLCVTLNMAYIKTVDLFTSSVCVKTFILF